MQPPSVDELIVVHVRLLASCVANVNASRMTANNTDCMNPHRSHHGSSSVLSEFHSIVSRAGQRRCSRRSDAPKFNVNDQELQ